MNRVHTAVTLEGDPAGGRLAPAAAVGEVIRLTPPALRRCVRMAAEGRSLGRGRPPEWLTAAADVTFAGAEPAPDFGTLLHFEAPRLGDAAPDLFRQRVFPWEDRRPGPDATAFDLFGFVLADVSARDADSPRFDRGLLRTVHRFRQGVGTSRRTARRFSYDAGSGPRRVVLDPRTLSAAEALLDDTPPPRRVKVVGTLDMVRASTRAFGLRLDTGEELPGVLVADDRATARERLADLLDRRVVAHGRLVYRPSGRPLRLDADELAPTDADAPFFSQFPPVPTRNSTRAAGSASDAVSVSPVAAVFGRWPGDETDEQIAAALREIG